MSIRVKKHGVHGMTKTPEYRAWCHMKERCNNPIQKHYPSYGGRGIKVCDSWNDSFMAFYEDVGPRPSPKHSLDRVDNNKGYSPDNVRWATQLTQTINRSYNKNNSSGYRGVSWDKAKRTYASQMMINGKHIFLGHFADPKLASEAYEIAKAERLANV